MPTWHSMCQDHHYTTNQTPEGTEGIEGTKEGIFGYLNKRNDNVIILDHGYATTLTYDTVTH